MLSGLGTLFVLIALVVLTHALQIGVLIMGLAMAAGIAMLLRDARNASSGPTPLPPAEQLAVELAEEPAERVLEPSHH